MLIQNQKKKVLFVISSNNFVRNYLTTDAFELLEVRFDCSYIASDKVSLRALLEKRQKFLGFYHYDEKITALHSLIFDVLMWRYRDKSTSFRFRILRQTSPWFTKQKGGGKIALEVLKYAARVLRMMKVRLKFSVLSSNAIFPAFEKRIMQTLPLQPQLLEAIRSVEPDVVVFPSSAYDPEGNDIARICIQFKIPSLFLIDNWDNLSSKSIFWAKPTYLGVWGKQSIEHAVDIQGMEPDRVHAVGTPRFDHYFRCREQQMPSHFAHKYILFVGTALAFDEAGALAVINQAIAENQELFAGVKLVYRPHPWRQGKDSIKDKQLEHVLIDPQLSDSYRNQLSESSTQPDLSYYPSLLKNAEFVVGGLTSMIIETMIFGKKFLSLVYDDKVNFTNQQNALKYYIHFRGIEKIGAVSLCRDISRLPGDFVTCWQTRHAVDLHEVDRQREYYLHHDSMPYKERLAQVLENIADG